MSALTDWFHRLADVLIPAGDRMPAASKVVDLDSVITARPDLARHLLRAWNLTSNSAPLEALDQLEEIDHDAYTAVITTAAGGYYADSRVLTLLGRPRNHPVPVRSDAYNEYVDLLEPVVARGPIYRTPDDHPA
jgi:hypothetical protein